MVNEIIQIAYIMGGVLLLQRLLVAPLLVYRSVRLTGRYVFVPIDWEQFLSQQCQNFRRINADLRQLGFVSVVASMSESSHSQTQFALYRCSSDPCMAMIMSIVNTAGKTLLILEISQHYSDGTNLDVMNSPMPSIFPPSRKKLVVRFRKIHDAETLFQKFKIVRAKCNRADPIAPPAGRELQMVEDFLNEENRELVAKRFVTIDGTQLRPTLTAAYVMTWKLTWPCKLLFDYISDRHANSLSKA
jgi:hypothetical protein